MKGEIMIELLIGVFVGVFVSAIIIIADDVSKW